MYAKFRTPQNEVVAINSDEVKYMSEQTANRTVVYFANDHAIKINSGIDDAMDQLMAKPVSSRARK